MWDHLSPMSEDISICYKVIKKSSCIVSSGYGAVGSYTSIEQGKTTYLIETEMRVQSKHSLWMESQKQRLYSKYTQFIKKEDICNLSNLCALLLTKVKTF